MKTSKVKVVGVTLLVLIAVGLLPATRDELQWAMASLHDKAQEYARYLTSWPVGSHTAAAKSRYDERSWTDAQSTRTIESFRQYEQTHPGGAHLSEARTGIEHFVWQKTTNANTIKSLQAYTKAYPQGRFLAEAQTREAPLRADERPFTAACEKGTEGALRQFLSEFPGHAKEAEAQQALKDITEGRDIVDLIAEKKTEIETQGSGIQSVSVRVRKLVPYPLTVRIPVGSYFVSANQSSQNMVTTADSKVRLTIDGWQSISPSAACANRPKDIPSGKDSFTVQRSPHQAELARLMPVLDKARVPYEVRQAAVWIVTDNADYSDLGILVSRSAYSTFGGSRTILEPQAAQAMRICDEAGIDIAYKKIAKDCDKISAALKDGDLKKWLEQKSNAVRLAQETAKAEFAKLQPILTEAKPDSPTRMAAIGIVAGNLDYETLRTRNETMRTMSSQKYSTAIPPIHEDDVARALQLCEKAGIDITQKAIWRDRERILSALKDGDLKRWLGEKH